MSRIALDVGPLHRQPTGVGVYVASLARALVELRGPEEFVLVGRRSDVDGLPEEVRSITRPVGLPYPMWVQLGAARDVARTGASVAHFTDGLVPIGPRRATPQAVVTVHDLTLITHRRTHRRLRYARIPFILAAPRLARAVIVPSRATADDVVRLTGTPARRVHIVPLAPRVDLSAAGPQATADVLARFGLVPGRYLLALGTIEPRKNHGRLVAAYESLIARSEIDDDIRLAIAGPPGWGSPAILRRFCASPAAERIIVTGYLPPRDLAAVMLGAGGVAYVSLAEGFGLPVLDALACGAAVVTSRISSMPEVAGEAAWLVDPYDIADIAAGLRLALQARQRDPSGVAASATARAASFTWREAALQTTSVYEAVT